MTQSSLPDFSKIEWQMPELSAAPGGASAETPEGISLKPVYGPADLEGMDSSTPIRACRRSFAGRTRRCTSGSPGPSASTPASRPPRIERLLPPQPRGRAEGAFDRLRPRHPPRLRQRSPARRRRRGHGRRRHRLDPRHAHAVRRHPARQDERVDDDERRGPAGARALHRGRARSRASRRRSSPARSRTTSSKSSWCGTPTSIRPRPR